MHIHPVHDKYSIDNEGNITGPRGSISPYSIAKPNRRSTYRALDLAGGTTYSAHRFIWECYNGRLIGEGLVIDHLDGDSENNHPTNLDECTAKENMQRATDMGLVTYHHGSQHHCSKLTEEEVHVIILRILKGHSRKVIADDYGRSKSTIQDIASKKNWKHVWKTIEGNNYE